MIIHYLYCISTNQRTIFHRHRSLMSTFYQNYFFARCWTKQPPMKKVRVRRSYTTHIRRVHIRKRVHETYINHIRSPYTNASYMEKIFSSSIYPIRTVTSYQRRSDDTIHIDVTSSIESMVIHFWPAFRPWYNALHICSQYNSYICSRYYSIYAICVHTLYIWDTYMCPT